MFALKAFKHLCLFSVENVLSRNVAYFYVHFRELFQLFCHLFFSFYFLTIFQMIMSDYSNIVKTNQSEHLKQFSLKF